MPLQVRYKKWALNVIFSIVMRIIIHMIEPIEYKFPHEQLKILEKLLNKVEVQFVWLPGIPFFNAWYLTGSQSAIRKIIFVI